MTEKYEPFRLFSELLSSPRKRAASDRRSHAAEIQRTATFQECPNCGTTWPTDEADECEDCTA
jgi:hypothetical protein